MSLPGAPYPTDASNSLLMEDEHPDRHNALAAGLNEASDLLDGIDAMLAGGVVPSARTVTGTGMLTGGGDLSDNRTLNLASQAQATIIGRAAGAGSGTPTALLAADVRAIIGSGAAFNEAPGTSIPLTTVTRGGSGWSPGAGVFTTGMRLRGTAVLTSLGSAQTLTPTLKIGTANSNADTNIIGSTALGAGTAVAGSMLCQYDVFFFSATQVLAIAQFVNGATGITGISNAQVQARGSSGLTTITSTASALSIAPYFASTVAAAVFVSAVTWEIVAS